MAKHIELSFVTEDSYGSDLIRWFTHSDYSHVDIIDPDGNRVGARHSPWNGVWTRAHDYAVFTRDDRLTIPCTLAQYNEAWDWLSLQIGKPYDSEGLLRSFLFNAGRSVAWWDENQWWCSELAAVFIARATGIRCAAPASRVAPNDAYLFGATIASAFAL